VTTDQIIHKDVIMIAQTMKLAIHVLIQMEAYQFVIRFVEIFIEFLQKYAMTETTLMEKAAFQIVLEI